MATSMALGGSTSMPLGLGSSSPIIGGGLSSSGSIGSLTPSHTGVKFCATAGSASSVHSPVSTPSSTPNSNLTINTAPGSVGKCSVNSGGGIANNSSGNIMVNASNGGNGDLFGSKCKRKINFSNLGMPQRAHQPATVARRNARERNRVKQVNNGFAALKQHIPLGHRSKKMSKVETLRCAVEYIKNLQGMLTIHHSFSSTSPALSILSDDDSSTSDDGMDETENQEQAAPSSSLGHQQQQTQGQLNGVNNQRDAFTLSSSSSTSSSPTSSDFGAAVGHLSQHLAAIHSHHQQQLNQNHHSTHPHHPLAQQQHQLVSNSHLRHLSLNHHHHHHHHNHHAHHLHGPNGVAVAATLLVESNGVTVAPNTNQLSPTSSDDPSSPSYTSEASYVNSAGTNIKGGNGMYDYENYEPVSPEDEELLDAIAWWQQS